MFIKLVVLILVFGSSGVGLLSVRQSRLQAAHEMAEARHRIRWLDEQAGEIRTHIAITCTPDRVIDLLNSERSYDPAVHHPARFVFGFGQSGSESDSESQAAEGEGDPEWMDEGFKEEHSWILDDGTHVILIDPQ